MVDKSIDELMYLRRFYEDQEQEYKKIIDSVKERMEYEEAEFTRYMSEIKTAEEYEGYSGYRYRYLQAFEQMDEQADIYRKIMQNKYDEIDELIMLKEKEDCENEN